MAANKLTATSCSAARLADGEREKLVADGAGLFLYVRPSGKSWLFVFTFDGKRKKMALGPFPAVISPMLVSVPQMPAHWSPRGLIRLHCGMRPKRHRRPSAS